MMDIKKKIEDRIQKAEALNKERTKVEVLFEQAMNQLKEMGLNSLEEAQEELKKRTKEWEESKAEAERLIQEFDEKYKDFI